MGKTVANRHDLTADMLWRRAMERALYILPIFELPSPVQCASAGLRLIERRHRYRNRSIGERQTCT